MGKTKMNLQKFFKGNELLGLKGKHVKGNYETHSHGNNELKGLILKEIGKKTGLDKLHKISELWSCIPPFNNEVMDFMKNIEFFTCKECITEILEKYNFNKLLPAEIEIIFNLKVLGFINDIENHLCISEDIDKIIEIFNIIFLIKCNASEEIKDIVKA